MLNIVISKEELDALKARDDILAVHIDSVSVPVREYSRSPFEGIVSTIISQLISKAAASTIFARFSDLLGEVNVDNFLAADKELVIKCGISAKKYEYIDNIAKKIKDGILDFQELKTKDYDEVIKILTAYPGIGLWSAEMILIHSLRHPDILAYGDFGIRSGIMKVYGLDELSKAKFNEIKKRLSPYGTIASLYFWQAHSGE